MTTSTSHVCGILSFLASTVKCERKGNPEERSSKTILDFVFQSVICMIALAICEYS